MNSEWKTFLESQSGQIDDNGGVNFQTTESQPACALFDLSHLGLVSVSGEDAEAFLQGQVTNNVQEVTESHSQMSSYCTPKGRMMANFRVIRHNRAYLLQMPLETMDAVTKRLPMFILMSKVEVKDASDELVSMGVAGDCALDLLSKRFSQLPENFGDALSEQEITMVCLPGESPRFELIGSAENMISLWSELAAGGAVAANRERWSLMDIRAGIPTVLKPTIEAFVPQMTNMQLIDGVSFTKGCYTGQEVVARMKYLGKLKRRMYLAQGDSEQPPAPGDELFSSISQSGQGAGRIVDAQPSPDGGYELLAVAEIASIEADDLHLSAADGPKLTFRELPYDFEA
ncbi:YgfZ/GcvT domain-containing protein [Solemya velesiana gill symbiont]|uniref:Folate-binding protein YgfZ n=1 Tax=Solemya velesiana gill symbiont TaxID=1918948 RepID=A0A1T2KW95_9GAMM|nr:folate-binding protein YgfZ [Solemya velesiana gill symbiont]OOZ37094.1 folate-binding protein YgfZ [Solemya velesiana gill symbiont]